MDISTSREKRARVVWAHRKIGAVMETETGPRRVFEP